MSKGIFIRNQLLYWCSSWGVQNLTPLLKLHPPPLYTKIDTNV